MQSNFILHPFLKCEIHVAYQSVCKLYRLSDAYYVVTLNERERERAINYFTYQKMPKLIWFHVPLTQHMIHDYLSNTICAFN